MKDGLFRHVGVSCGSFFLGDAALSLELLPFEISCRRCTDCFMYKGSDPEERSLTAQHRYISEYSVRSYLISNFQRIGKSPC